MIADTTFLIHFANEGLLGRRGPARTFLVEHRRETIRTCVISMGEVAAGFRTSAAAWEYFKRWKIYALHRGIAEAAADVDRELAHVGWRLGENDNWIAGFCRFYREPVISADAAFDRVRACGESAINVSENNSSATYATFDLGRILQSNANFGNASPLSPLRKSSPCCAANCKGLEISTQRKT
jgi:predicted nucleic acid-binding protein